LKTGSTNSIYDKSVDTREKKVIILTPFWQIGVSWRRELLDWANIASDVEMVADPACLTSQPQTPLPADQPFPAFWECHAGPGRQFIELEFDKSAMRRSAQPMHSVSEPRASWRKFSDWKSSLHQSQLEPKLERQIAFATLRQKSRSSVPSRLCDS
jgi:hypothetical protein